MKKSIAKDIIPLLISLLLVIVSIGMTVFSKYVLNYQHYVGFFLVLISLVFYFKNKKLYAYIFSLTLIAGLINLIDIYYSNIQFGFGILSFNPIFLTLLILFFVLNRPLLNEMFPEKKLTESTQAELNEEKEKLIKLYEKKFQNKSESELKIITENKSGFVKEAKIGAERVLKNKYVL